MAQEETKKEEHAILQRIQNCGEKRGTKTRGGVAIIYNRNLYINEIDVDEETGKIETIFAELNVEK